MLRVSGYTLLVDRKLMAQGARGRAKGKKTKMKKALAVRRESQAVRPYLNYEIVN
jgi:hypothetical protein